MFVKLGEYKYLDALRKKGEMYFSPCKKFRELEETQAIGIGDKYDGIIHSVADEVVIGVNDKFTKAKNIAVSLNFLGCGNIPVYCLMKIENLYLLQEDYFKLRIGFPKHTYALIIKDECGFIDNVKNTIHSVVFAHDVFYEDLMNIDFIKFWLCNSLISNDNAYRAIYSKSNFFKYQKEYRIILPKDNIIEPKTYTIKPFEAEIIPMGELLQKQISEHIYDNKTA